MTHDRRLLLSCCYVGGRSMDTVTGTEECGNITIRAANANEPTK